MGVSIEKVQWFGHRRWPWDQYKIMKNNRAQLNTKRHTKLTYHVTDFIPFLKNRWLKRQNHNQHERSQVEHPAGAFCFSSNGKTTATTQTKQIASCLLDFVHRSVWLFPESRLAGWVVYPSQNSKRSFWANAKAPTSSLSSNVLCLPFCVF